MFEVLESMEMLILPWLNRLFLWTRFFLALLMRSWENQVIGALHTWMISSLSASYYYRTTSFDFASLSFMAECYNKFIYQTQNQNKINSLSTHLNPSSLLSPKAKHLLQIFFTPSSPLSFIILQLNHNAQNSMAKDNSKVPFKIIHAKLTSPFSLIKTPVHQSPGLSERITNISTAKRKQSPSQQRIVSIDLKQERKENSGVGLSGRKKILKLRRKTQSQDKFLSQQKTVVSLCSSERNERKNMNVNLLNPKLKCFEELNSEERGSGLKSCREQDTNWEEVILKKKEQLYSQIYKMDKKIFGLERDLDRMEEVIDKRTILDMIRRKTGGERSNICQQGEIGVMMPIHIHKNIYKMGKNRIT